MNTWSLVTESQQFFHAEPPILGPNMDISNTTGAPPPENTTLLPGPVHNAAPQSFSDRLEASLAAEQAASTAASAVPGANLEGGEQTLGGPANDGPVATGAVTPPPVALSPVKRVAQKIGLADFETATDEDLAARLEQVLEQTLSQAEQVTLERQRLLAIAANLPQQNQPAPQIQAPNATSPTQKQGWWNPPVVDERQVELYQEEAVDAATGKVTVKWRDDAPPALKQQVQAYQKYQQDFVRKFTSNPEEALAPMVEARAAQVVRQIMAEERSQRETADVVENFAKSNEDWLFARDPITNRPRQDQSGAFELSPEGMKFQGWMAEAEKLNITSEAARLQYAADKRELEMLRARAAAPVQPAAVPAPVVPQAPPPTPVEQRTAIQQQFLQRSVNPPSRSTVVPANGTVVNPGMSFANRLMANAARDGIA